MGESQDGQDESKAQVDPVEDRNAEDEEGEGKHGDGKAIRSTGENSNEQTEASEYLHVKLRNGLVEAGSNHSSEQHGSRLTMQIGIGSDNVDNSRVRNRGTEIIEKQYTPIPGKGPTYIRINLKHILPETLNHYNLPWEYDPDQRDYLLIKQYISHELQDELFAHTRRLRQSKWNTSRSISESILDLTRVYVPPCDDLGDQLSREIDVTETIRVINKGRTTENQFDAIRSECVIESQRNIQEVFKADIVSAHRHTTYEDILDISLEYIESSKQFPEPHFRWM